MILRVSVFSSAKIFRTRRPVNKMGCSSNTTSFFLWASKLFLQKCCVLGVSLGPYFDERLTDTTHGNAFRQVPFLSKSLQLTTFKIRQAGSGDGLTFSGVPN